MVKSAQVAVDLAAAQDGKATQHVLYLRHYPTSDDVVVMRISLKRTSDCINTQDRVAEQET